MNHQILFKFILLICLFFGGIFSAGLVHAQSEEKVITFESQITASKNGQIEVIENIDYLLPDSRHGIFRTIPLTSKVGDLYRIISVNIISVTRDGKKEDYKVTNSGDLVEIKIGDSNRTITGRHKYQIAYNVDNLIGNYADHDEIYWNVTGNKWQVPIASATAIISNNFGGTINEAVCFTGVTGSTEKKCTGVSGAQAKYQTTVSLQPGDGFSIVASFPVDTFPKTILSTTPASGFDGRMIPLLIAIAVLYYLFVPTAIFIWYKKTHHKSRFGQPSVNFDIPKNDKGQRVLPAEAGAIDTAMLEKNDIVATIFDLAIRKYIRLVDKSKSSKILGIMPVNSTDHQLQKLKPFVDSDLSEYEKTLMAKLFNKKENIDISDLPTDFYVTFKSIQDQVFESLVKKGFYIDDPTTRINTLRGFGIIFLILGFNFPLAGMFFYLSKVLNGQTDLGQKMDWQLDGLKIFLKNMRREYKWQADNLITVEKYIPYAIALGYIDEFMEQLKLIYPNYQPSWYSGRGNFYSFYPIYLSSMNSSFTAAAPASSSGFSSGGGFSGGGGGGGGGGSW